MVHVRLAVADQALDVLPSTMLLREGLAEPGLVRGLGSNQFLDERVDLGLSLGELRLAGARANGAVARLALRRR